MDADGFFADADTAFASDAHALRVVVDLDGLVKQPALDRVL